MKNETKPKVPLSVAEEAIRDARVQHDAVTYLSGLVEPGGKLHVRLRDALFKAWSAGLARDRVAKAYGLTGTFASDHVLRAVKDMAALYGVDPPGEGSQPGAAKTVWSLASAAKAMSETRSAIDQARFRRYQFVKMAREAGAKWRHLAYCYGVVDDKDPDPVWRTTARLYFLRDQARFEGIDTDEPDDDDD